MTENVVSNDTWAALMAPTPTDKIEWRKDGNPANRNGRWFQRYVAYVSAHFVRERLDNAFLGQWSVTIDALPMKQGVEGEAVSASISVARLIRQDVGVGDDYKNAATDAFKRAGVRFGIAADLYSYEANWVEVDGDGKYAKPLEDPGLAYSKRTARRANYQPAALAGASAPATSAPAGTVTVERPRDTPPLGEQRRGESQSVPVGQAMLAERAAAPAGMPYFTCPKCGGHEAWDNRVDKKNPKGPDFRCKVKGCDGARWLPKSDSVQRAEQWLERMQPTAQGQQVARTDAGPGLDDDELPPALRDEEDDGLPF